MTASPEKIRLHRRLGWIAVLHAAIVAATCIGLFFSRAAGSGKVLFEVAALFWLVLATLWFFWPFVLIFHPGRSMLRVMLPLLIAYPFYFIWSYEYSGIVVDRLIGRERLGLPWGMDPSPHGILHYAIWYGVGWVDAKKDIKAGRLVLEAYGFGTETPAAPDFRILQEKCNVEIEHIAGCVVNTRFLGHAQGHNVAMMNEIRRRCAAVVKEAEEEDARWIQSYQDGKKAGRAEAFRELPGGCLALEVSDPPKEVDIEFEKMLSERYQISLRRVDPNANPKMANNVFGHVAGNNEIIEAEVTRRFGEKTVEGIWKAYFEARAKN